MTAVAPDLSLEQFIVEMGRQPASELTHERFMDLVHRLRLSDELIASSTSFTASHYSRNLVCRTQTFELLVLCWRPGHESTIHDHAGALNAIHVHRGELTSRIFVPADGAAAGSGPVVMTGEESVTRDGWIGVDRGGVHQLADTTGDDLVTVHVYAPPLRELTVYSTASAATERRPLRYTLADDLD
jgi:predicted metal-dependent enzyme (double-stranded beta helix superfamily)